MKTMIAMAAIIVTSRRSRANVEIDDFQTKWGSFETVTEDSGYRGYAGNIHYVQYLVRDHPLIMRPGQQYKLVLSYQPDVAFADE